MRQSVHLQPGARKTRSTTRLMQPLKSNRNMTILIQQTELKTLTGRIWNYGTIRPWRVATTKNQN
jgi:hypothetical protein